MSLPQTRTIRHDDDDDDGEYGDEGDVVRTKTKTKSAPINPTEVGDECCRCPLHFVHVLILGPTLHMSQFTCICTCV